MNLKHWLRCQRAKRRRLLRLELCNAYKNLLHLADELEIFNRQERGNLQQVLNEILFWSKRALRIHRKLARFPARA